MTSSNQDSKKVAETTSTVQTDRGTIKTTLDEKLSKSVQQNNLTAGDTDTSEEGYPQLPNTGTTLNSFAESATVNNMTGEVSVTVPLVSMPTTQGMGPNLVVNLVYNSTSSSSIISPYLDLVAPLFMI